MRTSPHSECSELLGSVVPQSSVKQRSWLSDEVQRRPNALGCCHFCKFWHPTTSQSAGMASPLHRSMLNHDRCLTLLCGTIDPRSSLHSLCGDVRILSVILDLVLPEWRRQAEKIDLFDAAKKGQMPELREKLHLTDVDVNAEDLFGSTALIHAAGNGRTEALRLLLQCRGEPNRVGTYGGTAVNNASRNGHTETLRLLLQCGATPGPFGRLLACQDGLSSPPLTT